MREQKRLRMETIINNMLTIGKSTAQGLQARSRTCLYFAVCEQGDKHCVSKGLPKKGNERLAKKLPIHRI